VNHCRQRLTRRRWRWWPRLTEATPAPGRELDEAEAASAVRQLLAALPPDVVAAARRVPLPSLDALARDVSERLL